MRLLCRWLLLGLYTIVSMESAAASIFPTGSAGKKSGQTTKNPFALNPSSEQKRLLTIRQVHLSAIHKGYVVDIRYPIFGGEQLELARKLNRIVEHIVNTNIPAKRSKTGIPNLYSCKFKIHYLNEKFLSMKFGFEHSNSIKSINLELSNGAVKDIRLHELFDPAIRKPGDAFSYELLSDLCIEDLEHRLKEQLSLPQNTLIISEEFIPSFSFTEDGIYFHFPPGHVADGELGEQTAFIKYSRLRGLITKRSKIYSLARKICTIEDIQY